MDILGQIQEDIGLTRLLGLHGVDAGSVDAKKVLANETERIEAEV